MISRSKIRRTKRGQVLEIPSEVAFGEDVKEVEISRSGVSLTISPVRQRRSWDDFFRNGPHATEDFIADREDPPIGKRDD
jgi:antitoxin VapB